MKLLELYIREFGGLKDQQILLHEGLNLFEGENESGKSTVRRFIQFMFYGMPRRGTAERECAISRDGHCADGVLRLEWKGEEYRIERRFVESGRSSEKVAVYRQKDGMRVFGAVDPADVFLGVPRQVFDSTCCIGQMQCTGLGGEKGEDAIRNLLSTADEHVDIQKVIKRLEDIRVRYRHKSGKGGKLYELNEQINQERLRLNKATENHLRIKELLQKSRENHCKIEENEALFRGTEQMLSELGRISFLRRFDLLHAKEEELEKIRESLQKKKAELYTDRIPTEADGAGLRMLAESLSRAEDEAARATDQRKRLEDNTHASDTLAELGQQLEQTGGKAQASRQMEKGSYLKSAGISLMITGGSVAIAGFALLFAGLLSVGLPMGIALLGLTALGGILLGAGQSIQKKWAEQYGKAPREMAEYLLACEQAWQEKKEGQMALAAAKAQEDVANGHRERLYRDLRDTMARTAPHLTVNTDNAWKEVDRLSSFVRTYGELLKQEGRLQGLIENERAVLAGQDEKTLRAELSVSREALADYDPEQIREQNRMYAERLRILRQKDVSLREELIHLKATNEDPMILADHLAALRQEAAESEEYFEALQRAIHGIQLAGESMSGNFTPAISQAAADMMSYVSDGRYTDLRMGHAMSVSLTDRRHLTTTKDMMSGGTGDAAYIALRISLMMKLFGEDLPPLILDEALCQIDDSRMERVLILLAKLSERGMQCLLFTCHEREGRACEKLKLPTCRHILSHGKFLQ